MNHIYALTEQSEQGTLLTGLGKKNGRGGFKIGSQFIKEAKNIVSKEYQ